MLAVSLPDASVRLMDTAGRELRNLHFATRPDPLAFSADGKVLFTYALMVQAWKVDTGEEINIVNQNRLAIEAMAISPNGKVIAFADKRRTVTLVDMATGNTQFRGVIPCVGGLAFTPDNKHLAVAADNVINLCEVKKLQGAAGPGEPAFVLVCQSNIADFVFSLDGKHIAMAEAPCICRIYDIASKNHQVTIKPPGTAVYAIAFSPDGKTIASMGMQPWPIAVATALPGTPQVVRLWDANSARKAYCRRPAIDWPYRRLPPWRQGARQPSVV